MALNENIYKNYFTFVLLSCSSRDIKISKYATINKEDQYENNYLRDENNSINKSNFFSFFFKNILAPPQKKKFEIMNVSNEIYKKNESLLTWGGHSTFLFQKKNINVLIDPHFTLEPPHFLILDQNGICHPYSIKIIFQE